MKKRILCLLLLCVICLSIFPVTALASNTEKRACYIASVDCPDAYFEYAEANISKFILSLNAGLDTTKISVGTPFAFADNEPDVFYFPVMYNGTIVYLFRVYPNGESYSAAITDFLAEDIESLAHLTSVDAPMYLNCVANKIIATIGGNSYELFEYPESMVNENYGIPQRNASAYSVKNIKISPAIQLDLRQTRDVYEYITLSITEDQDDEHWCTAFCLAAIIRTQTNYTTSAQGIMTIVLGSNPSITTPFPWTTTDSSTMISVSNQYGLSPVVLGTTASNGTLCQEINAGRPCIVAMSAKGGNHAVVLRGYSSIGTWSVWNPWGTFYENYSMDGPYVPTGYSAAKWSFVPYMHAYNFG